MKDLLLLDLLNLIEEQAFSLKECPITCFPECLQTWMQYYADQMQIPIDFLAAPLLAYIGAVIGRKRAIVVRQETDWFEFPNLWGMIIGKPSLMKSPAMKAMQKPLAHLITKAKHSHEETHLQYIGLHDRWKMLKKAQEDQFRKQIEGKLKAGNIVPLSETGTLNIEAEPKAPILKRYRTDDSTIEKLAELLIENPTGLLLFRDELTGWLYSFEKQGRENDRPFFLESWSGKSDYHVDRIGRGSLYVPALCMSIFGSIQPGLLTRYIQAAVKGGSGDDGFIQRFQIMVWPDFKKEWKLIKIFAPKCLEDQVIKIFEYLDQLTFDLEGKPIFLEFSQEAQVIFDGWQCLLENRTRASELPPYFEAHLAKYKKLVPTLALIFDYIWEAIDFKEPKFVEANAIRSAIIWAEYFESHAEKIYGSSINQDNSVSKGALETFKKRPVERNLYSKRCLSWQALERSSNR